MKQSCEKTSTKNSPVSRRRRREELSFIADECIMNYNRNRYDETVEFCLDCLYKLRKQKCIPSPLF